jgi:uncharacterized repeat protein (TIGR01451 family)
MKVWKKLQVVFLALLLCTGMMTQPALAASLLQDRIEAALTTDKETYQQGEEIKVTLTVTNTNDTAVTNLSLENVLPENFVLAENTETTKKMESLQAGETVTLTTVCTVKASDDKKDDENKENPSGDDKKNPTDNEKPGNGNVANDTKNPGTTTGSKDSGTTLTKDQGTGNAKQNGQSLKAEKLKSAPKMGDNTKIIVWVVLLVLAGAAIVVALKKKNRRNKMLAWFLCLIMTGSTVAGVFPERARAEAQSVNIGKVMELSKNILVDQTTVELKAKVEYTYVKSDDPSDDTKTYTRGEWVQMLAEKVEMNLDTDPDSLNHYYADTAGNAYEAAIEIAEKYGILPPPDIEDLEQDIPFFYPDEPATREFAAYTAVHAMGFNGIHSYDTNSWTDWDSITYQNEAAIAVGKGFLELQGENQFQPKIQLSAADVEMIFKKIDEIRQEDIDPLDDSYDNIQYVDGVLKKELENVTDYNIVENSDGTYTVTLPRTNETEKIVEGSIIVLTANEENPLGCAFKVITATEAENKRIFTCVDPELWEVVKKIDFVAGGTATVGEIVAADGVEMTYDPNGTVGGEYAIATQGQLNFGGSVKVPGKISCTLKDFNSVEDGNIKIEFEIPDITCAATMDISRAGIELDRFKFSLNEKLGVNLEVKGEYKPKKVKLGELPLRIPNVPGIELVLGCYATLEIDGTVKVTYEFDATEGFEYKNDTWRNLNNLSHNFEPVNVSAGIESGLMLEAKIRLFKNWELAGYYIQGGVGAEVSDTVHNSDGKVLLCTDASVYPFLKHGVDTDTEIGKALEELQKEMEDVCGYKCELEFEVYKNDENNPKRGLFHLENGRIVKDCTYGHGGISGYVFTAEGGTPVENARVKLYYVNDLESWDNFEGVSGEKRLSRILYTDENGHYSANNLAEGIYSIVASATSDQSFGLSEIRIEKGSITYVENIYMIDRNDGTGGTVEGAVTDAVTGEKITDASYSIRSDWNNKDGEEIFYGKFDGENFSLTLPSGHYTIETRKAGYINNYINITIKAGEIENTNIVLVPGDGDGETAGELRIVLTWGEEPWDLDSHLACYSSDKPYHIWFGQTDFEGNSVGNLDVDDTSSYGPETITVRNVKADEKFSYFVHDYTNSYSEVSNEMSLSGAKVQVYLEGKNIATYTIPTNQPGTLWHVFDFDGATKTIKSVNTFEYQSDPYTIGGIAQEMDDVDDTEEIEMYAGKIRNKKQPEQNVVVEETPLPETTSESVIAESEEMPESEEPVAAVSESESEPDDENVVDDETVTP